MSYDLNDKLLFSADAFGTFGALNGAIFADELDFFKDYVDEARRYYTNIVGKYGPQVQMLLKKAANVQIDIICPLHGYVWRKDLNKFIDLYQKWSTYTPEINSVMIAYASVYGGTQNAAEILATELANLGVKVSCCSFLVVSKLFEVSFKKSLNSSGWVLISSILLLLLPLLLFINWES